MIWTHLLAWHPVQKVIWTEAYFEGDARYSRRRNDEGRLITIMRLTEDNLFYIVAEGSPLKKLYGPFETLDLAKLTYEFVYA